MCGIAGLYNFLGKRPDDLLVQGFAKCLVHRGPDDSGTFTEMGCALASTRLSIIDLSPKGHMPMVSGQKNHVIAYNGEVYNFEQIKRELEGLGVKFESHTDTEVILESYIKWGEKCLHKFNGMFAFAIYDRVKKELFIARDRFGVKPLFYSTIGNDFVFGSEIKVILRHPSFRREVNPLAISSYLSYRYPIGANTFFNGVFQLLPGYQLKVSKNGIETKQWYDIPQMELADQGEEKFIAKTRELLEDSVRLRLVSDVPLGCYLSGGLDSTIVTYLTQKLKRKSSKNTKVKTYTIGFADKGFNEFGYAKKAAEEFGTDHKEITLTTGDYLKELRKLIRFKDAPLSVPNEIALYALSRELRRDITVVLSGEGADEIFSGYGRIFQSWNDYERLKLISSMPSALRKIFFAGFEKKYGDRKFKDELGFFLFNYSYFPFDEKIRLFNEKTAERIGNDEKLNAVFSQEFERLGKMDFSRKIGFIFEKIHLPGLLLRLDSPTMAVSVEGRTPFVDFRLVEFALNLPLKYKLKWKSQSFRFAAFFRTSDEFSEENDIPKHILRKAYEGQIPQEIIERKKVGFPVPLDNWFGTTLLKVAKKDLFANSSKIRKFFDMGKLESWIDENSANKTKGFGQKLWMILNLEYFLQEYFG